MRKKLFIVIFVLFISISFASCIDTDNGKNEFVKAESIAETIKAYDKCQGNNSMREFVCWNNSNKYHYDFGAQWQLNYSYMIYNETITPTKITYNSVTFTLHNQEYKIFLGETKEIENLGIILTLRSIDDDLQGVDFNVGNKFFKGIQHYCINACFDGACIPFIQKNYGIYNYKEYKTYNQCEIISNKKCQQHKATYNGINIIFEAYVDKFDSQEFFVGRLHRLSIDNDMKQDSLFNYSIYTYVDDNSTKYYVWQYQNNIVWISIDNIKISDNPEAIESQNQLLKSYISLYPPEKTVVVEYPGVVKESNFMTILIWLIIIVFVSIVMIFIYNDFISKKVDDFSQVKAYIKEMRSRDFSDNEIRRELLRHGWNDDTIKILLNR